MRVGYALCASFCTLSESIQVIKRLVDAGIDVTPIMSETAYNNDTRFGSAKSFIDEIELICNKPIIHTIVDAEPIGPHATLDILVVAPCTGNTLGKLAGGITDTSVTMACKAQLRNNRPVLIAISTNDGLSASALNIGKLQLRKNVYFVPYGQDNPINKSTSLIADFNLIPDAIQSCMTGSQIQPLLI